MSKAKRKQVTMIVTVSVKNHVGALEARRQVRQILESELTWDQHMKVRSVKSAAALESEAGMWRAAYGRPVHHPRPSKRDETPPLLKAMESP